MKGLQDQRERNVKGKKKITFGKKTADDDVADNCLSSSSSETERYL